MKDEQTRLAIEALKAAGCVALAIHVQSRIEALERFERAYKEWIDKTEWVQETAQQRELGKHRADVLRERIEALEKDAARYRWLREQHWSEKGMCVVRQAESVRLGSFCPSGEILDAEIDAAMQGA